jgi:hypothetical protein
MHKKGNIDYDGGRRRETVIANKNEKKVEGKMMG